MKKYPPSPKKATAQTVASNNIIAYGIFRFHEGMSICRFHELSHSHASLLIEMGCQPLLIADRLGHEKIQTTLNTYSHLLQMSTTFLHCGCKITLPRTHLYPNKQAEVAAQLENVMNGTTVPNGSQMAGVANL